MTSDTLDPAAIKNAQIGDAFKIPVIDNGGPVLVLDNSMVVAAGANLLEIIALSHEAAIVAQNATVSGSAENQATFALGQFDVSGRMRVTGRVRMSDANALGLGAAIIGHLAKSGYPISDIVSELSDKGLKVKAAP